MCQSSIKLYNNRKCKPWFKFEEMPSFCVMATTSIAVDNDAS